MCLFSSRCACVRVVDPFFFHHLFQSLVFSVSSFFALGKDVPFGGTGQTLHTSCSAPRLPVIRSYATSTPTVTQIASSWASNPAIGIARVPSMSAQIAPTPTAHARPLSKTTVQRRRQHQQQQHQRRHRKRASASAAGPTRPRRLVATRTTVNVRRRNNCAPTRPHCRRRGRWRPRAP